MNTQPNNLVSRIPHRPPMHWLDDAAIGADGCIVARRLITADHPFVADGFLIPLAVIEMLSQAAACGAAAQSTGRPIRRGKLASIRDLVFYRSVAVGDTVTLCGRHERSVGTLALWQLNATIDAGLVAETRMAFHLEYSSLSGVNS